MPEAYNFIKKETVALVFSCEFCKIFIKTFFTEHLQWLLLKFPTSLLMYSKKILKKCIRSSDKRLYSFLGGGEGSERVRGKAGTKINSWYIEILVEL